MAASGMANLEIPDPNLGQLIQPEWGVGNHLLLAGVHNRSKSHSPLKGPTLLHEVSWNVSLSNMHARRLVSEGNSLFVLLQRLMLTEVENPRIRQQQLVKISHKYRSIIKSTVDQMQLTVDNSEASANGDTFNSSLEEQRQIFFKIELVWNLVEIMFIDLQPAGALLVKLLDWVRWNFPECESLVKEVMETDQPSNHPSYWNAVYGYLLQGRIVEVRQLLKSHKDSATEEFIVMNDLLRKMPVFSQFGAASTAEFQMHWHQWHESCNLILKRGVFQLTPCLEKMCKLMCGDRTSFLEMTDICETWYFMMVSRLLYTNPCVKATDLKELAHEYIDIFGGLSSIGDMDRILLSTMEFNVLDVVKEGLESLDSCWFVAHLADLLHHVGHLDTDLVHRRQGEVSLREFLLLEYASGLSSHDSMWHFAIDYFDQCPTMGKQMIEAFLERTCLQSEYKTNKVLHIALQRDMNDLACTICTLAGRRALTNGRLGSALSWAVKAKDTKFATYLAEHFILEYVRHGRFYASHLLDNLGHSVLVSNKLAFLGKYREFHRCFSENKLNQAADLLVSLLSSRLAPKAVWFPLLLDAIPLLESKEAVLFNREQTYELLYCLEELPPIENNNDERMKSIQLALARNLARTFPEQDFGN